jgi:hypothetical protein
VVVNPETGTIRAIPDRERPAPRELALSEVEARVLERYLPELRTEILRRWRAGAYRVALTADGPELVTTAKGREQNQIRETLATWKAKKARRHQAALSRAKNRRRSK